MIKIPHDCSYYIINEETGCWEWQKYKDKDGYGRLRTGAKKSLAHRHYYEKFIEKIPKDREIDHICHNPSCVNPEHLRLATHIENSRYRLPKKGCSSIYKGVSWHKGTSKWQVKIMGVYVGLFDDEVLAAKCYDKKAIELYGNWAALNFPRNA